MDMLNHAVSQGAGIEVLEKLMALQERWERNQARKAFDAALAAATAEIPVIAKNKQGHTGKYADFAALARVVDPIISKHGLHYRFRTTQDDRIRVTCILSHDAGHAEENSLVGPADTSGSKNAIQAIGSTLTYLQRYTLSQALGLAASDDDDGKAAGGSEVISDEQAETLRALLTETRSNIDTFCKFFRVESVPDLPAARYAEAVKMIEAKKQRGDGNASS
jgi:hypothetical protein